MKKDLLYLQLHLLQALLVHAFELATVGLEISYFINLSMMMMKIIDCAFNNF